METPCTVFRNLGEDLRGYGINLLTGEACAYSMRYLCDFSSRGQMILEAFFGLPPLTKFNENWNSHVNNEPAVGSIMLTSPTILELMRFIALHIDRAGVVYWSDRRGDVVGYKHIVPEIDEWYTQQDYYRMVNFANPAVSSEGRNIHQATGRIT